MIRWCQHSLTFHHSSLLWIHQKYKQQSRPYLFRYPLLLGLKTTNPLLSNEFYSYFYLQAISNYFQLKVNEF